MIVAPCLRYLRSTSSSSLSRDGKKARAVLLYSPSDEYMVKNLIRSNKDPETVSRGKQRLKVLKKVLRNPDKVWNGIKKYFR